MNRRLSRWLIALYPRRFRDRYGAEVSNLTDELIDSGQTTPLRASFDLTFSAVSERGRALSRPRRVLVTAMAFAMLLIFGFALTGSIRSASSQPNFSAIPASCRVTLQMKGKQANFPTRRAVLRQTWTETVGGKSLKGARVVLDTPRCGPMGFACKGFSFGPAGPPPARLLPAVRISVNGKSQLNIVGPRSGKWAISLPARVHGPGCPPPPPQGHRVKVVKRQAQKPVQ